MTSIIVDTSVATKWYLSENETDSDRSSELRESIVEEKYLLVCPQIITLELANVLRFGKKMSGKDCLDSVNSLVELCTSLVEVPKMDLITDIMYKHDLTSYDAAFIALANSRNIPFITADYKHHKKEISKNIVWLSQWDGKL